jgi:hypothetical protein
MTAIFYTVDTELSPGFFQRGLSADENLRRNVFGEVGGGQWGVRYQTRLLNQAGLKGVFFVETLCALVYGEDVLKRIVAPILEAGHEVQLHAHPEWLMWARDDTLRRMNKGGLAEFDLPTQRALLGLAIEMLERAGAPRPTAFRAGNYGANNDTLRALADLGIVYDSSYNFARLGTDCRISTSDPLRAPALLDGVVEVPITYFEDYPAHTRYVQLCALSSTEMRWVITDSVRKNRPSVVIVSHGFELLNVERTRPSRLHLKRFDELCATLSDLRAATSANCFSEAKFDGLSSAPASSKPLKSNAVRTALRMLEQAAGTPLFDRL